MTLAGAHDVNNPASRWELPASATDRRFTDSSVRIIGVVGLTQLHGLSKFGEMARLHNLISMTSSFQQFLILLLRSRKPLIETLRGKWVMEDNEEVYEPGSESYKEYDSDCEEVLKLWNKYVMIYHNYKENSADAHQHTPPGLVKFFLGLLGEMENMPDFENEEHIMELVNMMDQVFQFGTGMGIVGFDYNKLTPCDCFKVPEDELKKL